MNNTNLSTEQLLFYKIEFMLQVYGGLLLFVGIPANFICGIVMGTDKSNHSSTRLLMVLLAAVDSAVLMTALLRYWMIETFKLDIRSLNALSCVMHTFLVAVFTDAAIANLCALAVERFVVVAFPYKSQRLVNLKNCIITMVILYCVLVMKNSFSLWFMELKKSNISIPLANYTQKSEIIRPKCLPKHHLFRYVKIFSKVDFISYSVLPYFLLFSTNTYIFVILRRQNILLKSHLNSQNNSQGRRKNRGRQSRNIIKILTALTLVHLVTTVPGTIYNFITQFFHEKLSNVSPLNKRLISDGLMMLMFTNNATNFLAYLTSDSFRQRIVCLFTCSTKPTSTNKTLCVEMTTVQQVNYQKLDPDEENSKLTPVDS